MNRFSWCALILSLSCTTAFSMEQDKTSECSLFQKCALVCMKTFQTLAQGSVEGMAKLMGIDDVITGEDSEIKLLGSRPDYIPPYKRSSSHYE